MGITQLDVTVIVPTRGRKDRLGTLLSSLNHPHDLTIVVVDDGRESEDLPSNLNGQVVVKCQNDSGAVRAMESGIMAAKTSHVICLNDDVEVDPECIPNAIEAWNAKLDGKDGVLRLNSSIRTGPNGDEKLACFPLMSRKFYLDHCYPSPYRQLYQDTEWTSKAIMLGCYAVAEEARLIHDWEPRNLEAAPGELATYQSRMADFSEKLKTERPDLFVAIPSGVKVFIAVPILFSVDPHYFDSMVRFLCERQPFNYQFARMVGDSDISRARNNLTAGFLASDCTHLLFIDSDLVFSGAHVSRLLSHDEDIVGGFYPKKKQSKVCDWVFNARLPAEHMDARRLTKVNYMGTGFLMVKRAVIEKMIEQLGDELMYEVDEFPGKLGFDVWRRGVYRYPNGKQRYLTEDWYFCQTAMDLGYTVYGDNGVVLKHSGNALYPLDSQEKEMRELGLFGNAPLKEQPVTAARALSPSPRVAELSTA